MISKIFGLVFLVTLFVGGITAQTSTATLSGSVTDANDAAVVGATVTITNTENGVKRTVVTNSEGGFTIPLLQPSKYQLTVQQNNFSPFEATDLVMNTNDNRFINIKLKAGSINEKVTVEANTVEVDTTPAVATTVDRNMVERIPLNGRTIQNLIALSPGAVTFGTSSRSNVGQISVNGLQTTQNYMTIDGVSANLYVGTNNSGNSQTNGLIPGFSQLGTTSNLVSVDALQEFKVQTSNYSAEYGRTPGAQIQLTTRSGENSFHGTLSEYFRNEKLDANDWFANANKFPRAPLRHNNFGGTISGPIIKNKTFFFFSYEGTRIRLPQTLVGTVPSQNIRNTANPSLRPFFSVFPNPTGPDNANGTTAPFVTSFSNQQTQDSTAIRIDHNLTSKISIFGRFSYSPQENLSLFPQRSLESTLQGKTRTLTFGMNTAFLANLANEFRFNWSRNSAFSSSRFYSWNGTTEVPTELWRPSPLTVNSLSQFLLAGSLFARDPGNTGLRKQINVTDTMTWVKGNHLIKSGFDYRHSPSRQESPDYLFRPTYNTLASVQTGIASRVSLVINNPRFTDYTGKNFGAFIQDTWRVNKRLTLDYGVRWDVNPATNVTPERRLVTIDFVSPIRLAEPGAKLYPTVWSAFAPRLGAAYQLSAKDGFQTVLRGGYGLFYDVGSGSTAPDGSQVYFPFTAERLSFNAQFPFSAAVLTPPVISTTPPYQGGNFLTQFDKEYVLPRVHQWNAAIEQGLGKEQTLSVTYVGNAGRRLLRQGAFINFAYPVPSPDFSPFTSFSVISNAPGRANFSDYHAMQVQFNRRGKNISTIVNYTWSHAIDTSSSLVNLLSTNFLKVDPRNDRADSDFDRRHVFSAAVTWSLPSVSKNVNSVLNAITRDWSFDAIFQYQTSYPMDISYQDFTDFSISIGNLRPDRVAGQPLWISSTGPLGRQINPAAFSIPTTTRQGNFPRNGVRVNSLWQPDIALSRSFSFSERVKLRLKGEMFNVVNHPMFSQPSNFLGNKFAPDFFLGDPGFGQFTTMLNRTPASEGNALSSIYAPGGPRSVQLSLKLSF